MTRLALFSILLLTMLPLSAIADDKKDAKELAEENRKKVEAEIKKETPITEWISSENALLKRLPKQNQQVFFILRNKHSVMRAVETVQKDVGNAVTACAKNNKSISKEIKSRYKSWMSSIDPILKEAKKFLEVELKQQEAFHVTDYRHIVKLNDKAYAFSEGQIKKEPVTSLKACNGLLDSMDRTEENLINILQDVLLPEEVARERAEQAHKKGTATEDKKKK